MNRISFDDFKKLDLRVAKILAAERMGGSEKLVRIHVDIGDERRTIVAGVGTAYDPAALVGKEILLVANLEPRTIKGVESDGMLLAADDGAPVLLHPERDVPPGAPIR